MKEKRVVVCGAGIGGPALALWLQRVGWNPIVVEARSVPQSVEGAFLGVAPNGMRVLGELGLAQAVAEIGFACSKFTFVNHRGRALGEFDRSGDASTFGYPLTMLRRADLNLLLSEACARAGIEMHYDTAVTGIVAERHAAIVECGERRYSADLVVGCDGLRSKVRGALWVSSPAPTFSGLLDVGGFAPAGASLPFEPGNNVMVFGKRAFFGAFQTPSGETWWFHNGAGTPGGCAQPQLRQRLLALHSDDPRWVSEIIRSTPRVLGPWGLYEMNELGSWIQGRVALLGDAAHAMSPSAGQGASMALEDAMVLVQCLRDVDDVDSALAAYERIRRSRVLPILRVARRHSNQKAPGPVGRFFRDLVLPLVLPHAGRQQSEAFSFPLHFADPVRA